MVRRVIQFRLFKVPLSRAARRVNFKRFILTLRSVCRGTVPFNQGLRVREGSYEGVAPAAVFLVTVDAVERGSCENGSSSIRLAGVSTPPARHIKI